jgi:hypothetical protein
MRIVWISPSLLSWNLSAQGWKIVNERTWKESYDIWARADRTLRTSKTKFERLDGLKLLELAIDDRLRLLVDSYRLHEIPLHAAPSSQSLRRRSSAPTPMVARTPIRDESAIGAQAFYERLGYRSSSEVGDAAGWRVSRVMPWNVSFATNSRL